MIRIDLHVHSTYSNKPGFIESINSPKSILKAAKASGINAVGVTDHDFLSYRIIKPKLKGLFVLPGVEITTRQGHLLAYGLQDPIKPKLSLKETIEEVNAQDGFAVIPHPFFIRGIKHYLFKTNLPVEVFNSLNFAVLDWLARLYAKRKRLPMTCGSDSHFPSTMGSAYLELDCNPDTDEVISALKKGSYKLCAVRRASVREKLFAVKLFLGLS